VFAGGEHSCGSCNTSIYSSRSRCSLGDVPRSEVS
jgi:hypothetical protein